MSDGASTSRGGEDAAIHACTSIVTTNNVTKDQVNASCKDAPHKSEFVLGTFSCKNGREDDPIRAVCVAFANSFYRVHGDDPDKVFQL